MFYASFVGMSVSDNSVVLWFPSNSSYVCNMLLG